MTTAHRPTFFNAIGGRDQGGNVIVSQSLKQSARDLPSHKSLKYRPIPSLNTSSKTYKENPKLSLKSESNEKSNLLFSEDADFEYDPQSKGSVDDEESDLLNELLKIKNDLKSKHTQKIESNKSDENTDSNNITLKSSVMTDKWTNDCVFKNQAKRKKFQPKQFINDTIRSDFHKTFLK